VIDALAGPILHGLTLVQEPKMRNDLFEIWVVGHSNHVYSQIIQADQIRGIGSEIDKPVGQSRRSSAIDKIDYAERRCFELAPRRYPD
jgi:hypothetical protein